MKGLMKHFAENQGCIIPKFQEPDKNNEIMVYSQTLRIPDYLLLSLNVLLSSLIF